jgi:hypothetical protein
MPSCTAGAAATSSRNVISPFTARKLPPLRCPATHALLLAAALALFHLGNAAMLPLYGMAVISAKQGDPAAVVGATIVVAQTTMIAMSVLAMRVAERRGYWLTLPRGLIEE